MINSCAAISYQDVFVTIRMMIYALLAWCSYSNNNHGNIIISYRTKHLRDKMFAVLLNSNKIFDGQTKVKLLMQPLKLFCQHSQGDLTEKINSFVP